jgi:hypothetical protein
MSRSANRYVAGVYAAALLVAATESWAGSEKRPASETRTTPQHGELFIARQQIDAQVAKIDRSRNTLTLKTGAGRVQIEAAPAVPAYFRNGDRVVNARRC